MGEQERKHIVVVDDMELNLQYANNVLKERYKVTLVKSGKDALRLLSKIKPDLLLLDIDMPEMDGYELCRLIRADKKTENIPIVFLTAVNEPKSEIAGFNLGAMDYIVKPFVPQVTFARIDKVLELAALRENLEEEVSRKTKQLDRISLQAMTIIANTVDEKDRYSKFHSIRVAQYSEAVANAIGAEEEILKNIYQIALLHDIGKIAIPDSIINKPASYTREERMIVEKHVDIGADILKDITRLKGIEEGARYHHERYDGTGYPSQLKGEEIPLVARIIAIADAYDAMTTNRAYRKRLSDDAVKMELIRCRGTQFDPKITDIFLSLLDDGFIIEKEEKIISVIPGELASESNALLQKVYSQNVIEIKNEIFKDAFTGFWNRTYLEDEINTYLMEEANQGAVFAIDMDNFKKVNDTYGHLAGDRLIILMSDAIKYCLGEGDLACRIGGDEFVIFFKGVTDRTKLSQKAELLIDRLMQLKLTIDANNVTSASIGIAATEENFRNFTALYQNADRALYYVKQNSKNGYHFYHDSNRNHGGKPTATFVDLDKLVNYIKEEPLKTGAFIVELGQFEKIYQFIGRYIERNRGNAQLILYTLTDKPDAVFDNIALDDALNVMEKIIVDTIRRGDVTARFSSRQQLVILMDTDEENGGKVASKIMEKFSARQFFLQYNVEFEQKQIIRSKEDKNNA